MANLSGSELTREQKMAQADLALGLTHGKNTADVQRREKLIAQARQGIGAKDMREQAAQQVRMEKEGVGQSRLSELQQNQQAQIQQQQAQVPLPQARDIPIKTGEFKTGNPGIGENVARASLISQTLRTISKDKLVEAQSLIDSGQTSVINDPQMQAVLDLQLNSEDMQVLARGEASVSYLSQFLEGAPGLRQLSLLAKVNTPSERVKQLETEIGKLDGQFGDAASFGAANPMLAPQYLKQVETLESHLLNLESRIKLLAIQSPELQANPERILTLQTEISGAKNKAVNAKNKLGLIIG